MKAFRRTSLIFAFSFALVKYSHAGQVNPLSQVINLLGELKAKIQTEGEKELQQYKEYMEWCDDTQKETQNELTEETKAKQEEEAVIEKSSSLIESASANVEKTGADLSESESELQKASQVREKEREDFLSGEKELMDVLETIDKAMRALKKEATSNPASLAQITTAGQGNLVSVLGLMADAASLSGAERGRLVSLAQEHVKLGSEADDDISELGAPAGDVYESKSGSVIELLEDLKEKATTELSDLRQAEATAKHNFDMLQQSLKDEVGAFTKQLKSEKSRKADASEEKANTEGEMAETTKLLESSEATLKDTVATCQRTQSDHDESVKARNEELRAVEEATKVITEMAGGAADRSYSLFQFASVSELHTHSDLVHLEALTLVRRLAQEHHSAMLSQLAEQITSAMHAKGNSVADPFAKVKGLIQDLIARLQSEASEEASNKAYCDEEMGKTSANREDLTEDLDKATSKLEKAVSRVAKLKEEVSDLQSQLSSIASSQAEMDKLRKESHADYVEVKEDLEKGINGVRKALSVLREYYNSKDKEAAAAAMLQDTAGLDTSDGAPPPPKPSTHEKSSGAGSGIISMLELCEADFTKNMEKVEAAESDSLEDYEKMTEENKVANAAKETGVKQKTKEFKGLEVAITEHSSDRDGIDAELSAVLKYEAKLKERCVGKADSYEERKARRDEQIEGLKEAIKLVSSEASFAQRGKRALRRAALSPGLV